MKRTVDEAQVLAGFLRSTLSLVRGAKVHVGGKLWHILAHVKVEELRVGKDSQVVVKVGEILLGSHVRGRRNGVQVRDILRHVWCPSAIESGHVEWNGQMRESSNRIEMYYSFVAAENNDRARGRADSAL